MTVLCTPLSVFLFVEDFVNLFDHFYTFSTCPDLFKVETIDVKKLCFFLSVITMSKWGAQCITMVYYQSGEPNVLSWCIPVQCHLVWRRSLMERNEPSIYLSLGTSSACSMGGVKGNWQFKFGH